MYAGTFCATPSCGSCTEARVVVRVSRLQISACFRHRSYYYSAPNRILCTIAVLSSFAPNQAVMSAMHPRWPDALPPLSDEDEELLQAITDSLGSDDSSASPQRRRSLTIATSLSQSAVILDKGRKKTIRQWMHARGDDNTVCGIRLSTFPMVLISRNRLLTYRGAVSLHQKPIDVRARDVHCLRDGEYLNDVAINLVLRRVHGISRGY